ncbi:STAS/SEC14 domain-containing protein [Reichenbachiella carrageenanivorans]|uniref:STAS/SEC14 domain-containing protein n=1 Tax=Reichenbachiella carrageenanivorans TaxID=2979869 RepID=A0ABY6D3E9_9BACT|nr:STAS/SEC14 domain-containing protein [Reichenbachiella carrageenanivorans]UXX78365.1 STAS/SEC14 domain-containing protein [Reichenbachiella carrageenanivorans]
MVEQLETFDTAVLALEVIEGFTETDEKLCQKFFQQKLDQGFDQGFDQVNVLVKLDELKVSKSETKAFWEDSLLALRNYKKLGHLAIVAHANILKTLVPIDNLFFERASQGRHERYFDKSQLNEAFDFVNRKD